MFGYQYQDSSLTLAEGISEYYEVYAEYLKTRDLSSAGEEFFRCHDVVHVVFGCDVSLSDELVVKISSMFGTTAGVSVLKGYALPESKEVYEELKISEIFVTIFRSILLIPRTIWRCVHMSDRWHWGDFDEFMNIPLKQIREDFGVRVAH